MKLNLETATMGEQRANEVAEFIETAQAMEVVNKNGFITMPKDYGTWTQTELFEIGCDFGKQKEKEYWEKPEEFMLQKKYADILKQAISEYQKKSHIKVNSITIEDGHNDDTVNIVIKPTLMIHAFNIFSQYGELCAASDK